MEGKIIDASDLILQPEARQGQDMSAEEITEVITEHIIDAASNIKGTVS